MQYTSAPFESRVDWLTVTCTDPQRRSPFLEYAATILNKAQPETEPGRPWHWKGYHGIHKGQLTYGRRDDSDIIQLSSDAAHLYGLGLWDLASGCTRIDLAVTVKPKGEVSDAIRTHYDEARAYRKLNRPSLDVRAILGNDKWQTVYIGSRSSDLFARIYDKGAESGLSDYDGSIRYEVEVKGKVADRCFTTLGATSDRAAWIRNVVHQHFARRGVEPAFGPLDPGLRINAIRPITTDASRLRWLAETVKPTVERLLIDHQPEQLMAALGFPRTMSELMRLKAMLHRENHADPLNDWEDDADGKGPQPTTDS